MASDDKRRDLLAALIRALGHTAAHHVAFSTALAAQLGIGATDLECLALLDELGPSSAGQLADILNLTTGAITGVVDRLAAGGFVVRQSDPTDRRRVIVRPVFERMADVERAFEPLLSAATHALGPYSNDDLRMLLEFQRLASALVQGQTDRLKAELAPSSSASTSFQASIGDVTAGCLEFANGAAELRIAASDDADLLYSASFEGPQPAVRVQLGEVTVRYRRLTLFDLGKHAGSVSLNSSIPWSIALRGGASNVTVDMRGMELRQLTVTGGASKLEIALPAPRGSVPICIEGGLNRVQIHRPYGVAAQVQIQGGANRLEFDEQRFGAVGGNVRLASPGWELATDRYVIEASGGASRFDINQKELDGGLQ